MNADEFARAVALHLQQPDREARAVLAAACAEDASKTAAGHLAALAAASTRKARDGSRSARVLPSWRLQAPLP